MTSIQIVALALIGCFLPQRVAAQRAGSVRLGLTVEQDSVAAPATGHFGTLLVRDTTSSREARTVRGALIGAGIGAAIGLIGAFIASHKASVTDHSEDGLVAIYSVAYGALAGFVVGGIVGFIRD
jgi:hypothetical protein